MRRWVLPLVGTMWLLTGAFLFAISLRGPEQAHPNANPQEVILMAMLWMSLLVIAVFLRFAVIPDEVTMTRRIRGAEAALERAAALEEAMWYLLGLAPYCALLAYALTDWIAGAAAMWAASLLGMILLAPDHASLERLAAGSR